MKNQLPLKTLIFGRFFRGALLGFLALFLLTSCEKSYLGGRYKITGVLYDTDGVTPLGNKELTLSGHNFNNFRNYSSDIKTVETDNNGFFEIPYWHNNKAGYLRISHSGGVLLSSITPNEDLERDICVKAIGYVYFDFQINRPLNESDTLIVMIAKADPVTTIHEGDLNYILYPFDELERFNKVEHDWSRRPSDWSAVYWGVGYEEYIRLSQETPDEEGFAVNSERYYFEGFPYVDTVEIVID